jgi:hypothetical protein
MKDFRSNLNGQISHLREIAVAPDRRLALGLAVGAGMVAATARICAQEVSGTSLTKRFFRHGINLVAAGAGAFALWQTERVGELKERPWNPTTSVSIPVEKFRLATGLVKHYITESNESFEEAESDTRRTARSNYLRDYSRIYLEKATGQAEVFDMLGVEDISPPDGHDSWIEAVNNETKVGHF